MLCNLHLTSKILPIPIHTKYYISHNIPSCSVTFRLTHKTLPTLSRGKIFITSLVYSHMQHIFHITGKMLYYHPAGIPSHTTHLYICWQRNITSSVKYCIAGIHSNTEHSIGSQISTSLHSNATELYTETTAD